ncbi:hypothetical protein FRC20_005658 [Serendipita sp. 405]|nr:hypothetical protein FRC15_005721 [Serendipita sp. 397]KAG8867469.1 hypothetical protein FRC20_005658 [Serendipita sp. 405]
MQTKASDNLDGSITSAEQALDNARQRFQKLLEEMEGVQTEISSTQRTVDTLRTQKAALLEELQGLRTILHPVRKLPLEVLAMIFTMAVKSIGHKPIKISFSLSQVCRTWRQAAIGHPSLWTSIFINLQKSVSDLEWAMKILQKRTGVHPVSLELFRPSNCDDILLKTKMISSSCITVRSLTIRLHSIDNMNPGFGGILPDYRRHLSSLQELSLVVNITPKVTFDYGALDNFFYDSFDGQSPCIKRLSVQGTRYPYLPISSSLPTLTHLSISGSLYVQLLDILTGCPNLQEVTIEGAAEDNSAREDLNLPAGQKLSHSIRSISVETGPLLDLVMDTVQMPHLQSLRIGYKLQPSLLCELSELEILDVPDFDPEYWELLSPVAPNIKTLCIRGPNGVAMLAAWPSVGITPPFKKLEVLKIDLKSAVRWLSVSVESFDRLVERRCLPGALTERTRDPDTIQLHTIEIEYNRQPMAREWPTSQYLKHAEIESFDGGVKIVWPQL